MRLEQESFSLGGEGRKQDATWRETQIDWENKKRDAFEVGRGAVEGS